MLVGRVCTGWLADVLRDLGVTEPDLRPTTPYIPLLMSTPGVGWYWRSHARC